MSETGLLDMFKDEHNGFAGVRNSLNKNIKILKFRLIFRTFKVDLWNEDTKVSFEKSMMHFLKIAAMLKSFLYETEFESLVKILFYFFKF